MTTKVKPSSPGQLQCQTLESPCWCPGCCSFQRPDFISWIIRPFIIYDINDITTMTRYIIYHIWLRRDLSDQLLVRRETSTGSRSCVQFAEKALGAIVLVLGAKTILMSLMSFWIIDTTLKIMSFCQTSGSYAMETFSATSEILATGIVERSPPI